MEFDENDFDYQQYVCSELEGELEEQEELEEENEEAAEEEKENDKETEEEIQVQPKITKRFLDSELAKLCENDRLMLHFKYNGISHEGKVIAKLSGTKYLFNLIIPKKGLTSIDSQKIESL